MPLDVVALLPIVKEGIEQAWKWRRSKALAEQEAHAEIAKAFELAARLAGSVLFELRANVERVRYMVKHFEKDGVTFGTFDFSICNSLMPRLCEVLPTPAVLAEFHQVLAALRRVDFHQRTGASAPMVVRHMGRDGAYTHEDDRGFERAVAFAKDALDKGLVNRFNGLLALTDCIGEAALDGAWAAVRANFLPPVIDPTANIDHFIL